jgi:hypothetical protein
MVISPVGSNPISFEYSLHNDQYNEPIPEATKYSKTGQPNPPAPITKIDDFFNLSWPATTKGLGWPVSLRAQNLTR